MNRRRGSRRRSAAEWGARAAIASLLILLGYLGSVQALAGVLRARDPARADRLAPWDGRFAATYAQRLAVPGMSAATQAKAELLAQRSLRQDATAGAAASTLAIAAQLRSDTKRAARLMTYAQTLSRRDLGAQLWLVEASVARGDVKGALYHYDVALRTSNRSADLLFPILASAISDPQIRSALTSRLLVRPTWANLFVEYAANKGPEPIAVAGLFLQLQKAGFAVSDLSRGLLVDTMTARGEFENAWTFYASFRRDTDRRSSRNPNFSNSAAHPTAFDWQATSNGSINASIAGGALDFSVQPGVSGDIVQQYQMLPPGNYRFEGRASGIDQVPAALPYWKLSCRNGPELGRILVPQSATADGVFNGEWSVPAQCPIQILTLVAQPSDTVTGLSGQIDRAVLKPSARPR